MTPIKRFFLFICLSALAIPLSAQQITGFVFDEETGDSIPYARVLYKGHHIAVVSDTGGRFTIARHEGWTLTFSAVGYLQQRRRPRCSSTSPPRGSNWPV